LRQFRELTDTLAPPSDATDEERADIDDALAGKIEAAILPNLDRWLTLRRRPQGAEEAGDHRPTSRFVPLTAADADVTDNGLLKDDGARLWALLSGPRHDIVKAILAEPEFAAEWEVPADSPSGPAARVPPCLDPPKPRPKPVKANVPPLRLSTAVTVPILRGDLVAMAVNMYIAAGALASKADHNPKLYDGALATGRNLLALAGLDVSKLDNDE
jgi:hypothetical protein